MKLNIQRICCIFCVIILVVSTLISSMNIVEGFRRRVNYFSIWKSIPTVTRAGLSLSRLSDSNDAITVIQGVKNFSNKGTRGYRPSRKEKYALTKLINKSKKDFRYNRNKAKQYRRNYKLKFHSSN